MLSRRGLITGLVSFVAAPAIVRAGSLMPVKAMVGTEPALVWYNGTNWVDLGRITRDAFARRRVVEQYWESPIVDFIKSVDNPAASCAVENSA